MSSTGDSDTIATSDAETTSTSTNRRQPYGQGFLDTISEGWADTASCSTPASEIDMMEGQGSTPNTLYGTIHTDSAGRCGGHRQNSNNWRNYPFSLANSWHIYAALWTPSQVCWYLDNLLSHCAPTYPDTDASPMHMILYQWAGGWEGGPTASTPNELHTEVDWVRVWQR